MMMMMVARSNGAGNDVLNNGQPMYVAPKVARIINVMAIMAVS
jgi:hypothetical protein